MTGSNDNSVPLCIDVQSHIMADEMMRVGARLNLALSERMHLSEVESHAVIVKGFLRAAWTAASARWDDPADLLVAILRTIGTEAA